MLLTILQELNDGSPEIEASWIVSVNGITLASALPNSAEEDRAGAICAGMRHFAEKSVKEFARGCFENALIKGENGYVLLANAGEEAFLAVLTKPGAKLDKVFDYAGRAVEKIRFEPFAGLYTQ